MSAHYSTWRDVLNEFIPRVREAERGTPEADAILAELLAAGRELAMPVEEVMERGQELFAFAIMMNHPDGDRFIWEHTGARVGTMKRGEL